jgi:uncharacterized membrane protein YeaQ/YmgE (transglycosylase-associated protein family)
LVKRRRSCWVRDLIVGVIGALIGGLVLGLLGIKVGELITATVEAVILSFLLRSIRGV